MLAAKSFFEMPPEQLTPRMEEDFFSSLMTRNKTYKTTFHNRFSDINTMLREYLLRHGPSAPRIMDVGVSSGISTVELYDDLNQGGLEAEILATDILVDASLVRVFPGCHTLVDPDGFPLRLDLPFVSMKPWVTRGDYYNGMFLVRKLANALFTHRVRRVMRKPDDHRIRRVKLVTPRALSKTGINICRDDISQYKTEYASNFDFIRAANVLNKGYFPPGQLVKMITHIAQYLREPHGSLLVVRTHDDRSNHGTLFSLGENKKFEVVQRYGNGSEIEDVVLRAGSAES